MITTYTQATNTVGDEAVLFSFDDCSWPFVTGGRIVLTRPTKYPGNPVLRHGGSGDPDEISARLGGTVLAEDGKFRMWYVGTRKFGRLPGDGNWEGEDLPLSHQLGEFEKIQSLCYAESDDGLIWMKPKLGERGNAIETDNMEDNASFVLRDRDTGEYIIVVADMPAGQREGDWYRVRRFIGPLRIYSSPDGLNLTPIGEGESTPHSFEGGAFFHFQGHYFLGGQTSGTMPPRMEGEEPLAGHRAMSTLKTKDWRHWPDGLCHQPFYAGFGDKQNHGGVVCTPRGNVCLGMTGRFAPAEGGYRNFNCDLGFVLSNDGLHWREPVPNCLYVAYDQEETWAPGLRQSEAEGTFMRQSGPFLEVGDETWMYYSAATMGGNTNYRNYMIGLMTIPRDRFGYMERLVWDQRWTKRHRYRDMDIHYDNIAMFSCPIECTRQTSLYLNYESGDKASPVTAQLWDDERMETLEGYSHYECPPLVGDSLRAPVNWEGRKSLPLNKGFTIELRLGKTARFYAAYIAH